MGLFGRHKKKKEESHNSRNDASNLKTVSEVSSNPAPPQQPPQPAMDLGEESKLSPPPSFGENNNLGDIRNQVSSMTQSESDNIKSANMNQSNSTQPDFNNSQQQSNAQDNSFDVEDDSLFDLSDFDMKGNQSSNQDFSSSQQSSPNDINFNINNTQPQTNNLNSQTAAGQQMNYPVPVNNAPQPTDTNMSRDTNLNFISNKNLNPGHVSHEKDFFITTHQFRSVLEIIESVKNKVKESSETHLRLMDIKSEEDIEYENLRKDFQFIEDKLYELDSVIFEK